VAQRDRRPLSAGDATAGVSGPRVAYVVRVDPGVRFIPGGLEPPDDIAPDVFEAATRAYLGCRRVDMGQIAAELGVVRSTVFRRGGRRDDLIAEVIWYLTRHALVQSIASSAGRSGADRVLAVVAHFMRTVAGAAPLRAFLEREPEIALRVLTSKHGPMQAGIAEALTRLLDEEEVGRDRPTLAYAIVRLGEAFLYADVVADQEPDVDRATELIEGLVIAGTATHREIVR
jgi:AcrR family transcriptional regulator